MDIHRRSRPSTAALAGTPAVCLLALLAACGGSEPAPEAPPLESLVSVRDTRLFVHREGAGEPLLVVHGGPLLDHGYLVEPLRPLADDYELVFFDQRLSGRSEGVVDSASVTLEGLVADIEAIREAVAPGERLHLLGHSWGGLLALKYALTDPSRLRSLVLVSPMAPSSRLWQEEEAAARAAMEPADTAGMGALRASSAFRAGDPEAIERMLRLSFRGQLHDPADADRLRFHVADDYRERSRQFALLADDLSSYDLTDQLPELRVPTLLVYGASEVGVERGAEALESGIPDARTRVLEDAGHFSFLERPEAFRRAVRAFLERTDG